MQIHKPASFYVGQSRDAHLQRKNIHPRRSGGNKEKQRAKRKRIKNGFLSSLYEPLINLLKFAIYNRTWPGKARSASRANTLLLPSHFTRSFVHSYPSKMPRYPFQHTAPHLNICIYAVCLPRMCFHHRFIYNISGHGVCPNVLIVLVKNDKNYVIHPTCQSNIV